MSPSNNHGTPIKKPCFLKLFACEPQMIVSYKTPAKNNRRKGVGFPASDPNGIKVALVKKTTQRKVENTRTSSLPDPKVINVPCECDPACSYSKPSLGTPSQGNARKLACADGGTSQAKLRERASRFALSISGSPQEGSNHSRIDLGEARVRGRANFQHGNCVPELLCREDIRQSPLIR